MARIVYKINSDFDDEVLINDQEYVLECLDRAIAQREMQSCAFQMPKSVIVSLTRVNEMMQEIRSPYQSKVKKHEPVRSDLGLPT